jgi:hypothetical protein
MVRVHLFHDRFERDASMAAGIEAVRATFFVIKNASGRIEMPATLMILSVDQDLIRFLRTSKSSMELRAF